LIVLDLLLSQMRHNAFPELDGEVIGSASPSYWWILAFFCRLRDVRDRFRYDFEGLTHQKILNKAPTLIKKADFL